VQPYDMSKALDEMIAAFEAAVPPAIAA
jgi:hypothetical protein